MTLTRSNFLSLRYSTLSAQRLPPTFYQVVRKLELASKPTRRECRGGWQAKRARSACRFTTFGLANVLLANARSEDIFDFLCATLVVVLSLTETWLKSSNGDQVLKAACPPGYAAHSNPRAEARGGGMAVLHRTSVRIVQANLGDFDRESFEFIDVTVHVNPLVFLLVTIFLHPSAVVGNSSLNCRCFSKDVPSPTPTAFGRRL